MDGLSHLSRQLDEIWTPDQPLPSPVSLRRVIRLYAEKWDQAKLPGEVEVIYNRRLSTTLGRAVLEELRVELNPRLLIEHPDQLLPTLAHELAHLVVHLRYGRSARPHGREFRTLMRAVNLSPSATHALPVEHLRRRRGKYLYLHRCSDCGVEFVTSRRKTNCYCRACGPTMEWDIFRLPNTAAGRTLLQRLTQRGGCGKVPPSRP